MDSLLGKGFGHSTSSSQAFSFIRRMLHQCEVSHATCAPRSPDWFPTRLLDVSEEGCVRLIETTQSPPSGRYLTLSHCWGGHLGYRLLKDTVQLLKHGLSVHELPKNFEDAIKVTKYLNFKYLWIDALCIQQDSEMDWEREAASMHLVYANSICNLAASESANSQGGLFRDRSTDGARVAEVSSAWEDRASCHYICTPGGLNVDIWEPIVHSPLSRRGWVLQEALLASRTVYFGQHQVYWACSAGKACEAIPYGVPNEGADPLRPLGHDMKRAQTWWRIVHRYSHLSLTEQADKLVAISALAKIYKGRMSISWGIKYGTKRYLAGLWETDLLLELCWYVDGMRQANGEPSFRPEIWRAPSWSWASVEGMIDYDCLLYYSTPCAKVVTAQTKPKGEDDTGEIVEGSLVLQGDAFQVCISNFRRSRLLNAPEWSVPINEASSMGCFLDTPPIGQSQCWAIALALGRRSEYGPYGLLLRQTDPSINHFVRLGMFKCYYESARDNPKTWEGQPWADLVRNGVENSPELQEVLEAYNSQLKIF